MCIFKLLNCILGEPKKYNFEYLPRDTCSVTYSKSLMLFFFVRKIDDKAAKKNGQE